LFNETNPKEKERIHQLEYHVYYCDVHTIASLLSAHPMISHIHIHMQVLQRTSEMHYCTRNLQCKKAHRTCKSTLQWTNTDYFQRLSDPPPSVMNTSRFWGRWRTSQTVDLWALDKHTDTHTHRDTYRHTQTQMMNHTVR